MPESISGDEGIEPVASIGDLPPPATVPETKIVYVESVDDYYGVFQE